MVSKPSDVGSGTMSHLANLILRQYGVVVALAVLLIAMGIGSPSFLTVKNLLNILSQWTPVGIMAVGATYVIIAGGFDLSAAAGFALCAVVMASLASNGAPPALSILAALAVGILVGLMNALVVVALRVNPFMATLGTALILSGVPNVFVERSYIIVQQPGFDTLGTGSLLGISYAAMCLVLFLVVGGIVLAKTPYGQWIYAVGGNAEVSRLFGIRVRSVVASTYVFSGFCMGAAAAISTSHLSYSASDQDPALIFDVIVSVIIGGTSLSGGFGSIWRTAAGLAILASLQNGLNLLQVNTIAQYVVKGLIIIGALGLDVWTRRLRASSEQRSRLDRSNPTAVGRLSISAVERRPPGSKGSSGPEVALDA
jgi:ribose transport system permease protein